MVRKPDDTQSLELPGDGKSFARWVVRGRPQIVRLPGSLGKVRLAACGMSEH